MIAPITILVGIAALVSAFNPYTIGVLITLSSTMYGGGRDGRHVLGRGLAYVFTLFGTLLLSGILLLYMYSLMPQIAANYLALGIGMLVVCAGLLEIKDFLWYGQGISTRLPKLAARTIKALTKQRPKLLSTAMLGMFVAVTSLTGAGAPYLATIAALQGQFDANSIGLVIIYSGIFVFPLLILLILIVNGVRVSTLMRWKEESKTTMRLGIGLLLITLGWILILITSGTLNLR
jgi:hypothetical protein